MQSRELCIDDSPLTTLDEDVRAAFTRAACWFLATSMGNEPNAVPVGFKWIEGDVLLIADIFFGKTRANIAENPHVAVTVATVRPKCGFQIKGTASLVQDGRYFDLVLEHLKELGVDAQPHAAVVITPKSVYKLDPGTDAGKKIA